MKVKNNDYNKFENKRKRISEAKIYHSLTVLYPKIDTMVSSLSKPNLYTIGTSILNNVAIIIEKIQVSYSTEDLDIKIKRLEEAITLFSIIQVHLKFLQDTGISKGRHYTNMIPNIIDIEEQMENWLKSIRKKNK